MKRRKSKNGRRREEKCKRKKMKLKRLGEDGNIRKGKEEMTGEKRRKRREG